jgi:4-amino-4-deoxy-L-arabinose transferase-like glycosyltransferase
MNEIQKISVKHWLALGLFSLVLFGFAGFSGRPLTMHEARLPETSREMLFNHQWLLPTSGGRPWLERPPLPHWFVISMMKVFGTDRIWVARFPSTLMGTITVLLTALIAARWFDKTTALVAGYVLATSLKFYQYASLAEDDIFLAAMVCLSAAFFTFAESNPRPARSGLPGLFAARQWAILGFFAALGLSNLTKGPLLGILILGSAVGVYLLIQSVREKTARPLLRYVWLWGWLVLITLTFAWPLWAYHRYPDVLDNWKYDYLGRMNGHYAAINEPWWYYPPKLIVGLMPWLPIYAIGLLPTLAAIFIQREPSSPAFAAPPEAFVGGDVLNYRGAEKPKTWWAAPPPSFSSRGHLFVICWALVPLVVLSIPKGKHDHYLVPFLPPWAIIGAFGLIEFGKLAHLGRKSFVAALVLLLVGYCFAEAAIAPGTDHTVDDTAFLIRCRAEVPASAPLYIDGKLGPTGNLDFFRIQFYSRPDAILLHNLTFLRDQRITAPVVYVICRERDRSFLDQLGVTQQIDQSPKSHEMGDPKTAFFGRFTLYRLTFHPLIQRYPAPAYITSEQAMERSPGPWCGPKPE